MLKLAVLGAGGFVGARAVEAFHLAGCFEVRPIVRRPSSLARLARFALDCRLASALDATQLEAAFRGCDLVLHLATGDAPTITGSVRPVHDAAARCGIRRIVYLSSASVHGQAPALGTDETTPLHDRHVLAYNNAKVQAEREWKRLHGRRLVELVVLRPSIVYGPRSRWITTCAEELWNGRAYLIDDGAGLCNTIYVDNLLHAIRLAFTVPEADGQTLLVGDGEVVTWRDFYEAVAVGIGVDPSTIWNVRPSSAPAITFRDRLMALRARSAAQTVLRHTSERLKRTVKAALSAMPNPPEAVNWHPGASAEPQATLEMTLLQSCRWQLPWSKAAAVLGYQPLISLAEGMRRSVAWLEFAGYPVSRAIDVHPGR